MNPKGRIFVRGFNLYDMTEIDFKPFIHGSYEFTDRNGYVGFCRFSKGQTEHLKFNDFFYRRAFFSSSVTLEFKTKNCRFGFDYFIADVSSKDTLDVTINGKRVYSYKVSESDEKGEIVFAVENTDENAENEVVVYFPIDADFAVRNFRVSEKISPVERKTKVLWIGDSITQGYGTFQTSESFTNLCRKKFGFEILNQGIGGYYHDAGCLMPLEKFSPDRIIVSTGTNLHSWNDKEGYITDFYAKLNEVYGNVKTLSVTPLWRGDEGSDIDELIKTRLIIEKECEKYGTLVLSGDELVPHDKRMFYDNLHPNVFGAEAYAENLCKFIADKAFL